MDNVIIYDKLDELNEGIEYNGGGITSLLGKGCVKSVQRGSGQLSNSSSLTNKIISISTVDLKKSALVITFFCQFSTANNNYSIAFADLTASDEITIKYRCQPSQNYGQIGYTWTVIEFY